MAELIKIVIAVRSLDPGITNTRLVDSIEQRGTALPTILQEPTVTSALISRSLNFPVPGSEIAIEIVLGIATGIGEAIGKRIGEKVLDWVRENWPNASVDLIQLNLPDPPTNQEK